MTSYSPEIKRVILAALLHDVGVFVVCHACRDISRIQIRANTAWIKEVSAINIF